MQNQSFYFGGVMRLLLCVGLLTIPTLVNAANVAFVGNYGLDFSDNPNQASIIVSGAENALNVKVLGEDDVSAATELTAEKRQALWERLSLTSSPDAATCIKFSRDYLCHIDDSIKQTDKVLANIKSDYFFYTITQDEPVTAFPLK